MPEPPEGYMPKTQIWDNEIHKIQTIQRNHVGKLTVYIHWKNGKNTKVGMDKVYRHCPIPMLRFYEQHL